MPRFFFHLWEGELLIDPQGIELADAETAIARAFAYARDIAAADVQDGKLLRSHYIQIEGQAGEVIGRVTFAEPVHVDP